MGFPVTRMRRLRASERLRTLVRETRLTREALVYPLFVCPGHGVRKEVRSMPGVANLAVDLAVKEAQEVESLGIPAVILFGLPEKKDEIASGAWIDEGIVQQATRAIKRETKQLLVIADLCLCEYMSHGHCGVVRTATNPESLLARSGKTPSDFAAAPGKALQREYEIVNDATLEILAKTAVSLARAGVDIIAPSDMMDGRVAAIRRALDEKGFQDTPVLSYAAKYASAFYGPFREAAGSAPQFGDRSSYQMDPANAREALREVAMDLDEGADMVMVKPAMPCLDIVRRVRESFLVPLAAYQVSGEYSMISAAAERGWIDRRRAILESLVAIRRAGADLVLTYFAKEAAGFLRAG